MILIIKNIVSLATLYFLKIFFGRKSNPENRNIVFFNSEKIGDLLVSSVILENDDKLCEGREVYFLLKKKFAPLFSGYSGRIKIIEYDYAMYKWFLPYRFLFLGRLRKLRADKFYNLTPARGMLNDEISVLSGANKIYAASSDRKYLKGTGRATDKLYDGILFSNIKNEYAKHEQLLATFGIGNDELIFENRKTFSTEKSHYLLYKNEIRKNEYIVVSPLSTEPDRAWGKENYSRLCRELSVSHKIVLTGSPKERNILEGIRSGNSNIYVDTSLLDEMPGLIANCRMFIGGDSGLTHVALKFGKPLLAVLDGGYFNRYFPYKEENAKNNYIYKMMDCFECGFDCIYDKKLCITDIQYEDVMKKVKEILKKAD